MSVLLNRAQLYINSEEELLNEEGDKVWRTWKSIHDQELERDNNRHREDGAPRSRFNAYTPLKKFREKIIEGGR